MYIGITGILLASALSRVVTYVWYEPKLLMKDYFEQKPAEYYMQLLKNVALISALSIISLEVAGKMAIVALVCACVAVIFYSRSEGFAVLKEKCRGYMDKLKYKN